MINTSSKDIRNDRFVDRVAKLSELHDITDIQIKKFIEATGILDGNTNEPIQVADLFCGTGFTASLIAQYLNQFPKMTTLYCVDSSSEMLERSKSVLGDPKFNIEYIKCQLGIEQINFTENQLDLVTIKMGLHELPLQKQALLLKDLRKFIKPEGRIVIWGNHVRKDPKTNKDLNGFNAIIRKKDELAGYDFMNDERYFTSKEEMLKIIKNADFEPRLSYEWIRRWSTFGRFEVELDSKPKSLKILNNFVTNQFLQKSTQESFRYKQIQKKDLLDVQFDVHSGLIVAM